MKFCRICENVVEKGVHFCEDCRLHRRKCKECGRVYRINEKWSCVKLCPLCAGVKDVDDSIYVGKEELFLARKKIVAINEKTDEKEIRKGSLISVNEAARKSNLSAMRIRQLVKERWIIGTRKAGMKYNPLLVDYNEIIKYLKIGRRRVFSHDQRIREAGRLIREYSSAFEVQTDVKRMDNIKVSFSGIGWRPNKKYAAADFVLKINNSIVYGEVGGISIDKIFTYYKDKRVLWVSKDRLDWKEHIVYFDRGRCIEMNLYDFLNFLLEKEKKESNKIR